MRGEIDSEIERQKGEQVAMVAYEELNAFARKLQEKYPTTYDQYFAYHALIGSSVTSDKVPGRVAVTKQDFRGEDSVVLFMENHRKKWLREQTI